MTKTSTPVELLIRLLEGAGSYGQPSDVLHWQILNADCEPMAEILQIQDQTFLWNGYLPLPAPEDMFLQAALKAIEDHLIQSSSQSYAEAFFSPDGEPIYALFTL